MDHLDYDAVIADIMATEAGRGDRLHVLRRELPEPRARGAGGGSRGCLDYCRAVDDPFSIELLNRYDRLSPGSAMFTAGSACTGTYRALELWETAVNEAGSLDQADVVATLDHARITEGPGGLAEMVPGQHQVRVKMCIVSSAGGPFEVLRSLGHIDPKECEVGTASQSGSRECGWGSFVARAPVAA